MAYEIFFIFFPVLIAITSVNCTKNIGEDFPGDTDTTNINDTSLVKTLSIDYGSGSPYVYTFYYDAQKRITEIKSDNLNIDYEYSDTAIIKKNIYSNGSPANYDYYYFNNDSLLDSAFLTVDSITVLHVYFQYNSGKEVVQRIEHRINNGDTLMTNAEKFDYDNSRNPTQIEYYFFGISPGNLASEDKLIYSDTANIVTSADMMYPDYIRSKNLLRSDTHISYIGPGLSHYDIYSYEFDDHNRLKTESIQSDPDYFSYTKNLHLLLNNVSFGSFYRKIEGSLSKKV